MIPAQQSLDAQDRAARETDDRLIVDLELAAIVTAIAGLGRNLGADTTAEGVETPEQAAFVRAAGCTLAQGYLYARPVSAAEIRALLESAEIEAAVA